MSGPGETRAPAAAAAVPPDGDVSAADHLPAGATGPSPGKGISATGSAPVRPEDASGRRLTPGGLSGDPAPPRPDTAPDPLAGAVRRSAGRAEAGRHDPEPSLARRFGQIGVLGWVIVLPTLAGVWIGARIDGFLGSGITAAAALTMLGAALGLWLALRWMHDQ
ncbi:AtpZ/AtpI family protein [Rhodobacter sp. NSM]|uniref:AtpZ/AtpI family protein n=1 Tax=Rhodobacter sp. NSM TaxID=3457501 RepID=UPI003FD250A5